MRLVYARKVWTLPTLEKIVVVGVVVALFAMQLIDTRHGLWTPWTVSIQLVGCAMA